MGIRGEKHWNIETWRTMVLNACTLFIASFVMAIVIQGLFLGNWLWLAEEGVHHESIVRAVVTIGGGLARMTIAFFILLFGIYQGWIWGSRNRSEKANPGQVATKS